MGMFDRLFQRFAPAPVDVVDTHPPDDPNALGTSTNEGSRGPSVYFNAQSGAGLPGDPSWWSSWRYPRRLNERQRESFARDALIRRGLALKADAATGEGWRVDVQTEDENVDVDKLADEIQDYEEREQIALSAAVNDALLRADLHGFAIVWLGIEDGSGDEGATTDFATDVRLDSIKTIAWARVFDARDVDIKGFHDMESNEYGKPTAYFVKNAQGVLPDGLRSDKRNTVATTIRMSPEFPEGAAEIEVHASRCLLFMAPDGIPVPDSMQWHFANYFSAQHAIARGATEYSVGVYKIKNWIWKARNRDQQSSIERVSSLDRMKSMFNALILDDANEDYTRLGGSAVSGLEKMANPSMVDVAAALGVSVTQFWGLSPAGFSQGKQERENFDASVRGGQKTELAPQLRKFHTYVLVADDGPQIDVRPESREIEFNDLSPPDETETQTILSSRVADTILAFEKQILDRDEARATLESLSTAGFAFQIRAQGEPAPDADPNAPTDPDEVIPEVTEEDEPDELDIAFSSDPLPSDAGTPRDIAAELSERLGRKIPTGRVTKLARSGDIRSWSILGGPALHSLREVMTIIARANGLMPDQVSDE